MELAFPWENLDSSCQEPCPEHLAHKEMRNPALSKFPALSDLQQVACWVSADIKEALQDNQGEDRDNLHQFIQLQLQLDS